MKTVGDKLEAFRVTGVKPASTTTKKTACRPFEEINEKSFPGKWKVIYFYPKDFTFVCPTEIVGFDKLAGSSPSATPCCWAARPTTSSPSSAGAASTRT
jgi:peroxiredoxin (alkyl hydroperoxide reductase subunit C)